MNPVVTAIKGLPPREPAEPAASESQREQLRRFQIFRETTILELGVLQASYLINQAIQIRDHEEVEKAQAAKQKTKQRNGKWFVFVLIVALIFLVGQHYKASLPEKLSAIFGQNVSANAPSPSGEIQKAESSSETANPQPASPAGISDLNKAQTPPEFNDLTTFAGLELPLSVRVIEELSLLDKAGKETIIPVGTIITIEERKNLGSLTMKMEGEVFVGNESRLIHKVRLP